ncbi:caspase-8-like isoform X4 [Anguilla rostrata]|uniref:caspase-8-like isoform X4 n=1 Tax=Anguilla rostrata TaxID=7938 RepID=UPI0030D2060C
MLCSSYINTILADMNIHRTGREAERLEVLHKIDSELDSNDVAALKFLCRDLVPQKHLERVCDGRDLFMRLKDQGLLEDGFLGELLHIIRRMDLLRKLGINCAEIQGRTATRISPYRKMLYNLSEEVTEENLRAIKFLLKLPRGKLETSATFLDVLVAMEKQELLREDSLEVLQNVFDSCDKQLATRVQEFAQQRADLPSPAEGHNLNHAPCQESSVPSYMDSSPSLSLPADGRQQPPTSLQPTQNASVPEPSPSDFPSGTPMHSQLSVDTVPESTCEEVYDMRRQPRGHCIIINNYDFGEALIKHPELKLGNRDGTDVDERALDEVFSRLHFTVHHRRDLGQAQLLAVVEEFGGKRHGQLDAFVCCVLSHGKKGAVYGTDGGAVPIRQLTQPFTSSRCPSLAGKPKLFFIQACQAQDEEPPARADGPEDPYDTDAGPVGPDTIPNDSDFLLGMATVEDRKSYRHTYRGSAFIQELCEQLKWGCPREEDILSIMTRVNRKVSSTSLGKFKQMPEPRYTLTKKLIMSMD